MKKFFAKVPKKLRSKKARTVYVVLIGLFVMANLATWVMYRNKSFPNTTVASQHLGSVAQTDIAGTLDNMSLLPENVTLIYKDDSTKTTAQKLGIQVDTDKTAEAILQERSWLPVANFFAKHDIPFTSKVDDAKLQAFAKAYVKKQAEKPTNAKFVVTNGVFSVKPEKSGSKLAESAAADKIVDSITNGQAKVTFQPEEVKAKVTATSLQKRTDIIKKQQQTKVTLTYKGKTKTFTPAEIALWYEVEGPKAELADSNIQGAIVSTGASFGILVKNMGPAVAAAHSAVETMKPLNFTLVAMPKPTKSFGYCVATRGVAASYLPGLISKLASTYGDSRGWNLNNQVLLRKVNSGCDFTVWLAEASQMPSFGSICDSTWSCRTGNNVVINFTRWQNASPAWNAKGGSLGDYRAMVINHETGHWFGFYHKFCGGAGQLAPVMQQQSIDLQGCKFNPWPLPSERAELKQTLGL